MRADPAVVKSSVDGPLTAATRRELEAGGRLDSSPGQRAMLAAQRLDQGNDTGAAMAALMRAHPEAMAEALRGVKVADDPLDQLKALRDRKRNAG